MILYNGKPYFAVSSAAAAVFLSPSRHRYHGAFTMSFSDTVTLSQLVLSSENIFPQALHV
jgi:hypothetical protein